MNIVCENWLIKNIHEFESLQYDCYLQLGLLMFMVKYYVVRFHFIFTMFRESVLKFRMSPMVEA